MILTPCRGPMVSFAPGACGAVFLRPSNGMGSTRSRAAERMGLCTPRHPEKLGILHAEPRKMATSACGRSFETPRKGAAPQDDGVLGASILRNSVFSTLP